MVGAENTVTWLLEVRVGGEWWVKWVRVKRYTLLVTI